MSFCDKFLRLVHAKVVVSDAPYVFQYSRKQGRVFYSKIEETGTGIPDCIREFIEDIDTYVMPM